MTAQEHLRAVVLQAREGFTVSSDFARTNAPYVAMAASMALITTRVKKQIYCSEWGPTISGLAWLAEDELEEAEDDTDNG